MMQTVRELPRRTFAAAVLIFLAFVSLVGLYFHVREPSGDQRWHPLASHTFRVSIVAGADALTAQAKDGLPIFKARKGDSVTFVATSNQAGTLHIHVYDRHVPLVLGGEATLTFHATLAGAFPVHWHDPQQLMIPIAILEVQPR